MGRPKTSKPACKVEWTAGNETACRIVLRLPPVPASRPRFRAFKTRDGRAVTSTYYAGPYKKFLDEADKAIPPAERKFPGPVQVDATFYVPRPKTTKLARPKGDIDNYLKAIFDVITRKGYWLDDDEIVSVTASKQFTPKEGKIVVQIKPA